MYFHQEVHPFLGKIWYWQCLPHHFSPEHTHCLCTFLWPRCWPQAWLNENVCRTVPFIWPSFRSSLTQSDNTWDLAVIHDQNKYKHFPRAEVTPRVTVEITKFTASKWYSYSNSFLYLLSRPPYLAPAVCCHPSLRSAFSIYVWETVFSENLKNFLYYVLTWVSIESIRLISSMD